MNKIIKRENILNIFYSICLFLLFSFKTYSKTIVYDNAKLISKINDSNKFVELPLTGVYLIKNCTFDSAYGKIRGLKMNNKKSLLVFEMDDEELDEEFDNIVTEGKFLFALEIENLIDSYLLDNKSSNKSLLHNYENQKVGLDFKQSVNGALKVDFQSSSLNAHIIIETFEPNSYNEIKIQFSKYKSFSIDEFQNFKKNERKIFQEKRINLFKLNKPKTNLKIDLIDSIFNNDKYPLNDLIFEINNYKNLFKIKGSCAITGSKLNLRIVKIPRYKTYNFYDLIEGKNLVLIFHSFDEGDDNIQDDEVNYSLKIDISIPDKNNIINKDSFSINKAFLETRGFGPFKNYILETGNVKNLKIENSIVSGELEVKLVNKDNNKEIYFNLHGKFQLPILNYDEVVEKE